MYDGYVSRGEKIVEACKAVEATGKPLMIDQATFLIGMFKDSGMVEGWLMDCPRMLALLPEMRPQPIHPLRKLACADWMNREDELGYLATQLAKSAY